MYTFDLTKLNGFDFYLFAQFVLYDPNPWNMWYLARKCCNFDFDTIPDYDIEPMYFEFIVTLQKHLLTEQKVFDAVLRGYIERSKESQEVVVELPQQFKDLLDKLSKEMS